MASADSKPKSKISFSLGFRESMGVVLCCIVFFILPIVVIEYSKGGTAGTSETYTQEAITQAQGEGRVAGATTTNLSSVSDKYFVIPIINFPFDTTLSETSSIVFLFGVMMVVGGIVLGASLIFSPSELEYETKIKR